MSGEKVIGVLNELVALPVESASSGSSLRYGGSLPDQGLASRGGARVERTYRLGRRRPKRYTSRGPTPVPERRPFSIDARIAWRPATYWISLEGAGQMPFAALIDALIESDQVRAAGRLAEFAVAASGGNARLIALRELLSPPRLLAHGPAVEQDRRLEAEWLKAHREEYRGQWVAITERGLVGCARTLSDLLAIIGTQQPPKRPLIYRFD